MKKLSCVLLCLLLSVGVCGCKKDGSAMRVWIIQPSSLAAENEIRQTVRSHDASALISFVPATEINLRVDDAVKQGNCPDVFMCFTDNLPSFADGGAVADITARVSVSNVKQDELLDSARRACLYQGKTYAVPMFCDVYMLATNRALTALPPENAEDLSAKADKLDKAQISPFEKLTPLKQSLLFEALLHANGGAMLDSRRSATQFDSSAGQDALIKCAEYYKSMGEADSMGEGKSGFSIMTISERKQMTQKYPDAEIALSPLFGLNRLQTVALCLSSNSANQKRDFKMIEYLYSNLDKLSAAYKQYSAKKDITPLSSQDADYVKYIASATPPPDVSGYYSLITTHIPSAIDKASKGVNAADALKESSLKF